MFERVSPEGRTADKFKHPGLVPVIKHCLIVVYGTVTPTEMPPTLKDMKSVLLENLRKVGLSGSEL